MAAGAAIDWTKYAETAVPLPDGYTAIDAIYPESSVYQSVPAPGMNVVVVGDARQNEALYVGIHP